MPTINKIEKSEMDWLLSPKAYLMELNIEGIAEMTVEVRTDAKQRIGVLTKRAVMEIFEISNTTLHQWMKVNGFPKPTYLTSKCPVWREREVKEWVDNNTNSSTSVKTI